MSIRCQNWVYEHSESKGNDRLVLLAIADEADDDGTNAYPGIKRIAHKARLPERTVMRCLERLETAGYLIVHRPEQRGRGRFNTYEVDMKGDTFTPISAPPKKVPERRAKARKGAPPYLNGCRPPDPGTHNPCPEDPAGNTDVLPPDPRTGSGSQESQEPQGDVAVATELLHAVARSAPVSARHELLDDPDQAPGRSALRRRLVLLAAEVGPDAAVEIVAGEWPASVSSPMAHANARARDYVEGRSAHTTEPSRATGPDPLDGITSAAAAIAERSRAREAGLAGESPLVPAPDWKEALRMQLYRTAVDEPAAT